MDAYAFKAALLCDDCASMAMVQHSDMAHSEDSNDYPQGPFANWGVEADYACHCDWCMVPLDNPVIGED